VNFSEIKLGRLIASGSFADVYHGIWRDSEVAVKLLKNQRLNDTFQKEVSILSKLSHENIIPFIGATIEGKFSIVTEYFARHSLYEVLHVSKPQAISDTSFLYYLALEISKGMNYLHTQIPPILHRDLKSANVLASETWKIVIADFGISRLRATEKMTTFVGTPAYMSPELIANRDYNEKIDVYSFGILLWELFTGQVPFEGMNPLSLALAVREGFRPAIPPTGIPNDVCQLMTACWHDDYNKRPSFSAILTMMQSEQRK